MMISKRSARALAVAALLGAAGCGGVDEADGETLAAGHTAVYAPPRGFLVSDGTERIVTKVPSGAIALFFGSPPDGPPVLFPVSVQETAAPWGYLRHDGLTSFLYVASNGHPHQILYPNSGTYIDTDLTVSGINAPLAKVSTSIKTPTPDIIGYTRVQQSALHSAIVYISANDHIIELVSNDAVSYPTINNSFLWTDLTTTWNAPVTCKRGSAYAFLRSDGLTTLDYIGSDNHIHEFANWGTKTWADSDLFVASGETVIPKSDPTGYARSDGFNVVVFEGNDDIIHELAMNSNGAWSHWSLPSVGALNGIRGRPFGYVREDSVNAVVYVSNKNSVHQIALGPNGWADSPLPLFNGDVPQGQVFGLRSFSTSSVLVQVVVGSSLEGRDIREGGNGVWTPYALP